MTKSRQSTFGALISILISLIVMIHAFGILGTVIAVSFPTFYKRFWTYYPEEVEATPHEDVFISSRRGGELHGMFFRRKRSSRAVLLCHGRSRKKEHGMPYVMAFSDRYNVLTFDFASHGENPYGVTSIGYHEADDVLGALDWLAAQGMRQVAIVGHSMGAAAAIRAVSEYDGRLKVAGMVLEGAFASLGDLLRYKAEKLHAPPTIWWPALRIAERIARYPISSNEPVDWIARISCPVLFLQAKEDGMVPEDSARRLCERAEKGKMLFFSGEHDEPNEAVVRLTRAFVSKEL